jgi:hypothetical protein
MDNKKTALCLADGTLSNQQDVVDWETSARLLFLEMLAPSLALMTSPQLVAVSQLQVPTGMYTPLVEGV